MAAVAQVESQVELTSETQQVNANVVERVNALPIVSDTVSKAADVYTNVKQSNPTVEAALTKAEEAISQSYSYVASTKVASDIAPYGAQVNEFLVAQLDKLEAAYPIVKAPTEEIISAAKSTAQPTVDYVCEMAAPIVNYTKSTVSA